jgi:hypothetical protein
MMIRALPVAPVLSSSFVLTVYADSGDTLDALTRPLLVAIAASVILQLLMIAATRDLVRGSVVASLAVACVIDVRFVVVAVAVGVLHALGAWRRMNAQTAMVVPVILFALSLARVVGSEAFAISDLFPGNTIATDGAWEGATRPNIYAILLDGYPRADTLDSYGLDNGPFMQELTERGFDVASRSHGSYPFTAQVITSMLHMAHLPDIDALTPAPGTEIGQARAITTAVRFNPAMEFLERRGYRTVSTGLPATVFTLRGVDAYIDPGIVTTFEHQVLRRTSLWGWLDGWALSQLQSQVIGTLATAGQVATSGSDGPLFLFAHVMAPHTPFVFDAAGNIPSLSCDPDCERWTIYRERMPLPLEEYHRAYAEQVQFVNGLVLDTVDTIIAADPEAVVIVFSDHGARAEPYETNEWYRTFFAARTPGHPQLFDDNARAIEIFPRLFGAYFNERVPIPADVTYTADPDAGLQFPLDVEAVVGR